MCAVTCDALGFYSTFSKGFIVFEGDAVCNLVGNGMVAVS